MLTSHDLEQIKDIINTSIDTHIKASEKRVIKFMEERIETKLDVLTEQILDYTNTLHEAHEKRISKLEDQVYH